LEPSLLAAVHLQTEILWVAVYAALAAGMWWTGRVLAVAGVCVSLATTFALAQTLEDTSLMVAVAVCVCVAPARRPSSGQRRAWTAAVLLLLYIGGLTTSEVLPRMHWWMKLWPAHLPFWGPTTMLFVVAVLVCFRHRFSAVWLLAVALVGLQPIFLDIVQMVREGHLFRDRLMELIWLFEVCLFTAAAVRVLLDRRARDRGMAAPA
jgi:hypothetical protein